MKIKLMTIILGALLIASHMAYAQEPDKESKKDGYFAEHKAQMLKNLNEEKASIDQVISCANSAQKQDDIQKCHEIQKSNMQKMHERNRAERKERLQNELKKLDEEGSNSKKQ